MTDIIKTYEKQALYSSMFKAEAEKIESFEGFFVSDITRQLEAINRMINFIKKLYNDKLEYTFEGKFADYKSDRTLVIDEAYKLLLEAFEARKEAFKTIKDAEELTLEEEAEALELFEELGILEAFGRSLYLSCKNALRNVYKEQFEQVRYSSYMKESVYKASYKKEAEADAEEAEADAEEAIKDAEAEAKKARKPKHNRIFAKEDTLLCILDLSAYKTASHIGRDTEFTYIESKLDISKGFKTEADKTAFLLFDEGYNFTEIGKYFNVSDVTAKKKLKRIYKHKAEAEARQLLEGIERYNARQAEAEAEALIKAEAKQRKLDRIDEAYKEAEAKRKAEAKKKQRKLARNRSNEADKLAYLARLDEAETRKLEAIEATNARMLRKYRSEAEAEALYYDEAFKAKEAEAEASYKRNEASEAYKAKLAKLDEAEAKRKAKKAYKEACKEAEVLRIKRKKEAEALEAFFIEHGTLPKQRKHKAPYVAYGSYTDNKGILHIYAK